MAFTLALDIGNWFSNVGTIYTGGTGSNGGDPSHC